MPEIDPVAVFIESPSGSAGRIENTYAVTPPLAVTGVNAVAATFCSRVLETICLTVFSTG